jgi:hypothetical protein
MEFRYSTRALQRHPGRTWAFAVRMLNNSSFSAGVVYGILSTFVGMESLIVGNWSDPAEGELGRYPESVVRWQG